MDDVRYKGDKASVKVDLHVYPHFFKPLDQKWFRQVPSLLEVINGYFACDVDIVALSAHHNSTSGLDTRFSSYLQELTFLDPNYRVENHENRWLLFNERESGRSLVVLNSQVVRSYERDNPAEVHILGVSSCISPGKEADYVAEAGKSAGGIVLLPRIGRVGKGVSFEKASYLSAKGLVDAVEILAEDDFHDNSLLLERLKAQNIPVIPVSGAHHYRFAGASYFFAPSELKESFSLEVLSQHLKNVAPNNSFYGFIGPWNRFWTRDTHILLGFLGHYLAGGKRREENLRVTGLKK